MRIIFNLINVGLGNNGGSETLVKSANTLVNMGHEVIFLDTGKNQHTWNVLQAKHIKFKGITAVPSADFVIATGYKSVKSTLRLPNRCGKKCHWIRGWETWQMDEKKIINNILQTPTTKLVNSICLQRKLRKYGVSSFIVRPGYDFDDFYPLDIRTKKQLVFGGLYNTRHKSKRTDWILKLVSILKKNFSNKISLWMMGVNRPDNSVIDRYFRNPNMEEKNFFYNSVDIWLSPSYLEGLHICPAEAMLTECPVISTDAEMSGTQDYLENEKSGLVSKNDFDSFLDSAKLLANNREKRNLLGKNARQRVLSLGNRKDNMLKMVSILELL